MADSISIVMKMNDDISGKLKSISSTSKGVSKEFEVLQNRADALGKRYADFNQMSAKTAAEALDVKRAMDEAAKSFKKTGDEADQVRFQQLREEYTALTDAAKTYSEEAKKTQKTMRETYDQARKLEDGAGSSGDGGFLTATFGKTLGGALAASGVIREIGSSLTGSLSIGMESAVGQPMATALNSILSGAFSGAAAGAITGPQGAVIGALGGSIAGAISGGTQIFAQQDEAFKSYVQEAYDSVIQEQADAISSGSAIAGSREQTLMAFSQKLGGDQAATAYLNQVKEMAKSTNYTYDQITGYSKLLLNSYGTDETLDVLMRLSDATAGLNLNSSDNELWIAGLSRMRTTGKVTQEYLNYFSERGLDVYQALANATGADKSQIADLVSGGKISGGTAAQAILDYIDQTFGACLKSWPVLMMPWWTTWETMRRSWMPPWVRAITRAASPVCRRRWTGCPGRVARPWKRPTGPSAPGRRNWRTGKSNISGMPWTP
ncbi:tape measure protein [Dysosmobacter sp.]